MIPPQNAAEALSIKFGILEVSAFGYAAIGAVVILAVLLIGAQLIKKRKSLP